MTTPSQRAPDAGTYVWLCQTKDCTYHDQDTDKPYMLWLVMVQDGAHSGFNFSFRVYHSEKAKKWCIYALKKFGYPPELLDCDSPVIRRKEIIGKRGKVLVNVTEDNEGMVSFDIKGFSREHEMELEDKLRKERGEQMDLPEMDVNRPIEPSAQPPTVDDLFPLPAKQPPAEPKTPEEEVAELEKDLAWLDTIYLHGHDPDIDIGF